MAHPSPTLTPEQFADFLSRLADILTLAREQASSGSSSSGPIDAARGLVDHASSIGARDFSPADLSALRPYAVSMRQGQWDTSGIFNSTPGDVDALFFEHAQAALNALAPGKKLKFVLYAHGGLVSESLGLTEAQQHVGWWNQSADQGIYPIFIIWKTGLFETIGQLLRNAVGLGSRGLAPKAFFTDPVIAAVARRLGGEALWSAMKRDAELAVVNDNVHDGAATYVARQMKKFCDANPGRVELHAVGHSAGAVFHAHYIPMSTVEHNLYFTTTSFLAPAVTVETFFNLLTALDGGGPKLKAEVGDLTIFTMNKDHELKDNCAGIYRQSLLYLIYHAFEPKDKTPILGLEESIRADRQLSTLLGLAGSSAPNARVIWSPSAASQAICHGCFSSDGPTLNSILRRILGVSDAAPIHLFPVSSSRSPVDAWGPPTDIPELAGLSLSGLDLAGSGPQPVVSPAILPSRSGAGNRRALCVGINNYQGHELTGCVRDAQSWADVLRGNRFTPELLLDEAATYDGISGSLRALVQSSQPGDVLVFTYSGHGTTLPDQTGRTVDGVEEAMVPIDFESGRFLMDYDLSGIFQELPAGVNLTCFIDCCHSGTITRLMVGLAPKQQSLQADEHPRFIHLTDAQIAAAHQFRANMGFAARGLTVGGTDLMRDIVFEACKPEEVAWEANGQGDFTRTAVGLIGDGSGAATNQQFADRLVQAFGNAPRQHPMLDCAPGSRSRLLFGAL